ncbi:MAG TPA: SdpI family protein [Chloroflexota bacterium]
MRIVWRTEVPNWIILAGMFLVAAVSWTSAPERYPVHWNLAGQVDRYGGKTEGLLLMPVMTLAIYLALVFVPRIDPLRANYERFRGTYGAMRLVFTVSMAIIYGIMLLSGAGYPIDTSRVIPMVVGGMLVVVGNFLGKIRPNWFVGIRTPWTLSSRKSWVKTHRLGGWLFILVGLSLMLTGLVRTVWSFELMMAVFVASMVWMIAYSYVVWRSDPDRTTFWNGNREG